MSVRRAGATGNALSRHVTARGRMSQPTMHPCATAAAESTSRHLSGTMSDNDRPLKRARLSDDSDSSPNLPVSSTSTDLSNLFEPHHEFWLLDGKSILVVVPGFASIVD